MVYSAKLVIILQSQPLSPLDIINKSNTVFFFFFVCCSFLTARYITTLIFLLLSLVEIQLDRNHRHKDLNISVIKGHRCSNSLLLTERLNVRAVKQHIHQEVCAVFLGPQAAFSLQTALSGYRKYKIENVPKIVFIC